MTESILSFENVSYWGENFYSKKQILKDISFSLYKNEIKTLIGPNGSGKTTLIKILMDLIPASSGTVKKNKTLTIGYMPQTLQVNKYLPLTVADFLELYGVPDPELLEILRIQKILSTSFHNLSGGEKQRVLFARALINHPTLLVLDEPTQGVDVVGQNDFFSILLAVKEKLGCSVFMVSHDLHYVFSATDQVICLNQHICCSGKPEDVKDHAEYQRIFGTQDFSYKVAPYTHHHDHRHDESCEH